MSVVHEFEPPKKSPKPAAAAGGDGGGYSIELLERVIKIEAIIPTLATKDDLAAVRGELAAVRIDFEKLRVELHREIYLQTWRIIGMCGAMVAATYFIATHFGR